MVAGWHWQPNLKHNGCTHRTPQHPPENTPRHQLTETQTSAMPHNQHLTATTQTQIRYKWKQRVCHCRCCPRSTTAALETLEPSQPKILNQIFIRPQPSLPFIKGSLIPGILKFIPCEESTPLGRSVKFQRKLTTNQKITTNHTTNQTTNQTDFPQRFVPRRSSHYLWQHHPFWRPEIYRSTEDNG